MEIIYKTIEKDEKYLRQISDIVSFDDENLNNYINIIKKAVQENNNILALASVQIGIPKKIIYLKKTSLDAIGNENHDEEFFLFNPTILFKEGLTEYWEACVSCLDNTGLVERPYKVDIKYYDMFGVEKFKTFEGFESTVICHEIDHLDGILHIDIAKKNIIANIEERKELRNKEPYKIIRKKNSDV